MKFFSELNESYKKVDSNQALGIIKTKVEGYVGNCWN